MSSDYFLHHLTLSEATDYIKGQDRRHRRQWEMTRMIACGLGADFFEFTWEKERLTKSEEEMSEEEKEWEALRRKAEAINNRNKKQ